MFQSSEIYTKIFINLTTKGAYYTSHHGESDYSYHNYGKKNTGGIHKSQNHNRNGGGGGGHRNNGGPIIRKSFFNRMLIFVVKSCSFDSLTTTL